MEWVHEIDLTVMQRREIAALLQRAFNVAFPGRDFFLHPQHLRLLLRQDGALAGHMAITLRSALIGERLTTFAGVGDFAVVPEAQGQGFGRAMVQEAISHMRGKGVPLMLLFGTSGIYTHAGFTPARNLMVHPDVIPDGTMGTIRTSDHDLMALWLTGDDWDHGPDIDLLSAHF